MGILDSVFSGKDGVSAMLCRTLGGTATVLLAKAKSKRDPATGILTPEYDEIEVPFVPTDQRRERSGESAPGGSRSDLRTPVNEISGLIPTAYLTRNLVPERDAVVVGDTVYTITSATLVKVGDAEVQYTITARRM